MSLGTQGLWPAWISPSAQPCLGPGLVLLQRRMLEAHQSNILLSLAHKFYWCDLAFWLIGGLIRTKLFSRFSCFMDLIWVLFVWCEMVTGH